MLIRSLSKLLWALGMLTCVSVAMVLYVLYSGSSNTVLSVEGLCPPREGRIATTLPLPNSTSAPYLNVRHQSTGSLRVAAETLQTLRDAKPDLDGAEKTQRAARYFDFSRCPVSRPFLVYVYSGQFSELVSLQYPGIVERFARALQAKPSALTEDASEACIFVIILGPVKNRTNVDAKQLEASLHSLAHWNGGANHVLVDLSDSELSTLLANIDTGNAITVSSYISAMQPNSNFHILAGPIVRTLPASQEMEIDGIQERLLEREKEMNRREQSYEEMKFARRAELLKRHWDLDDRGKEMNLGYRREQSYEEMKFARRAELLKRHWDLDDRIHRRYLEEPGPPRVVRGLRLNDPRFSYRNDPRYLRYIKTPSLFNNMNALPSLLPAEREYRLYFEGQYVGTHAQESSPHDSILKELQSQENALIYTTCSFEGGRVANGSLAGEWALCNSTQVRVGKYRRANFSLVLGGSHGEMGVATYTRLVESLEGGSVPVIVGVGVLPFGEVINWHKAALLLPAAMLSEVYTITSGVDADRLMEYRRQGRFLFETYFSSHLKMLEVAIAIVRYRAFHPPPLAPESEARMLVRRGKAPESPSNAPVFQNSLLVYSEDLWNKPPGPFFMYPHPPSQSPQILHYEPPTTLSPQLLQELWDHSSQLSPKLTRKGLPPAVFHSYLLGAYPEEQFTVVTITYNRNVSLLHLLESFRDCPFLAKVVVVWNNEEDPPEDMSWPDIGVPIEVVSVDRNSLNNRFLPLTNIKTDAILSIDDDITLTHQEIGFAFRVWRENRDRLVGWTSRYHSWTPLQHWAYSVKPSCEISAIITNAAFFHKYYAYLYTHWMPAEIRQFVDKQMNCEDIAMNFLIAHIARKPPIKVGEKRNLHWHSQAAAGLSTSRFHFIERDVCLNVFAKIYGYMPLLFTQYRVEPLIDDTCFITTPD